MKRKKKPSANSSHQPDLTYIVSAFNRPFMLPVCLWAIKGQTHQDFECIVADNAEDNAIAKWQEKFVKSLEDPRFKYVRTATKTEVSDCYWSAEWVVTHMARGQWLCFPCDDTYLVPEFATRMRMRAVEFDADMVICGDVVLGPQGNGRVGYKHWKMEPGRASKTTFIVRKSKFPGFTGKLRMEGATMADWQLTRDMGRRGLVTVLPDQLMCVHN